MKPAAVSACPPPLCDLGALVTVQYPGRSDLALLAAVRLLSGVGAAPGITVAQVQGVLLTRRARNSLRRLELPAGVNDAVRLSERTDGGLLVVGSPEPALVILGPSTVLDVGSTYRLGDLGLPQRLLHGRIDQSRSSPEQLVVEYPYGLTGVYAIRRVDSPLASSLRLMSRLGPLTRRRLEHDLHTLEPIWRQLRHSA